MKTVLAFISLIRPGNAAMTGAAVVLGAWLTHWVDIRAIILLAIAAISAAGYGNTINDIKDVETDRTSHPKRPLPQKLVSMEAAIIFAFFLPSFAIVNAFMVSVAHGIGTLVPIVLLTAYAFFFKATPFAGNVLVSGLVAYPIIFGALTSPLMPRLLIPAALAFLLNVAREIVKDVQDEKGDRSAGIKTTARVNKGFLKTLLLVISGLYLLLLFAPFILKQFGILYVILCAVFALPIHVWWSILIVKQSWPENNPNEAAIPSQLAKISLLMKIEMLAGLAALAADQALGKF